MAKGPELTATSFAVLGLLAAKPSTPYELTRQIDRGLGRFWPRAASKLYEEPKKLAARGLAKGSVEQVGRRSRTVYAITPKGRRALAAWIATPAAEPLLELEALLKVFFAEHGSKQDLLATIGSVRAWAIARRGENVAIAHGYVVGEGPFPERLAHTLLVGRFLADFEDMVEGWAAWATGLVEAWPGEVALAEVDQATLAALAARGQTAPRG